jgi:hypothetical protein
VASVKKGVPAAIVLMRGESVWNFKWSIPTLRRQPGKNHKAFMAAVRKTYREAWKNRRLVVYLRREGRAP